MTRQSAGAIWKRARSLVALSCLAILAACGGGDDAPPAPAPETELSFLDSSDFQKVLHAVPADSAANAKAAAATTTTLTVHYKRKAGDYTGWQLHTWGAGADPGWNKGYDPTGTDSFGAIYKPTLSADSGAVGYLFHKGETKDHGGADQSYTLAPGANEIWRIEGDTVTYTKNPDAAGPVDIKTVRVHYKRYDGKYADWGVHMWNGGGVDVTKLPAGTTIDVWTNPVAFAELAAPGYTPSASEVVFDIPVVNPKTDSTKKSLTFIIHDRTGGGSDANKDGRHDDIVINYANLTVNSQVGEVWLVQEDATVYTAVPDTRSASTKDAKAYWLTKSLIQWPRVDSTGVFKLYYSKNAQIVAKKDSAVAGADGSVTLDVGGTVPADVATRFKYVSAGVVLSVKAADVDKLAALHTNQVVLVQENDTGKVQNATTAQIAGAMDDLYATAKDVKDLGVTLVGGNTVFKVWAPTAQQVKLGLYDSATSSGKSLDLMTFDAATGVWSITKTGDLTGNYYVYVADVFVRGVGVVRNRVTDPYSISLNANSKRSYIANLDSDSLKPAGWADSVGPVLANQVDMSIYELSVRDFSANDPSVSAANRGKFLAFTEENSNGMKHLKALQAVGLTDVHLLPVFDLATVPEVGCKNPDIAGSTNDSMVAQNAIKAVQDTDCFNWGYDPFHYTSLEGSYSTDANDGAKRIVEFRRMVMAMHKAGLRVGMDVVYNHTSAHGQNANSVLDRLVPGYYQRLNSIGGVENSTCCSNTATENLMMGKLMTDSVTTLATQYKIDSFRFDLMGHQPKDKMVALKDAVKTAAGRDVFLIGEGWNYGEVENGKRFVQASQLSLNGTGIGTFSDRGRDRIRGGNYQASRDQGYVTGYFYDQNDVAKDQTKEGLMDMADIVRVALAGSLRTYSFESRKGTVTTGETFLYGSDPAGYVSQPQEVVNYYENHDNATLWDAIVAKMPKATSLDDRVRAQTLAAALNSFSQGIGYFHAGSDILRSKSMDTNSYNSGDWFNRLDWSYTSNNFGVGLPFNADDIARMFLAPADAGKYAPTSAQIQNAGSMFRDLLAIRKSSQLFRLRTADDVKKCLKFYNTGTAQEPTVIAGHLNGTVCSENAGFKQVMYFINVDKVAHDLTIEAQKGMSYALHPVQASGSDARAKTATYDNATGKFSIPARTAVVFVTSKDAPAAPTGPVTVTFKVTANTNYGQNIYIVGDQPELGKWGTTASDSRKCTTGADYPVWTCAVVFPTPGTAIAYKFQKYGSDGSFIGWEGGSTNRTYVIPTANAVVDSGAWTN